MSNEKVNPYKYATGLLLRRLYWDICLESYRSRKRLKKIRNKFKGQSAVILCNGPSLLNTDFEMLRDSGLYTFGLNKINLLFDKVDFRPSTIVAVNPYVLEQNADYFSNTDIPLFLDSKAKHLGIKNSKSIFLHSSNIPSSFAKDCSVSINQGYTVTYVAMQLAFHMGFQRIALVGCDHNFADKGTPNKLIEAKDDDHNHFDPNYFSKGTKWQLPDLFQSEVHYTIAKNLYEENNREIYDCTNDGKLQLFTKMPFSEFLIPNKVQRYEAN
ncbi:6-hydroxymethylpterin diphosphokinase MptE-like protein [Saccharospirillum impatiens]|uniref:6-hydroxymethylpterin diphosphokinase MptE-like protein n=1 Tax=Saccharospirillum impatiens TaxID=169438 RepID=UPI000688D692|nr:6-hydroxymethylpterin diphosphokinase MptE-like protein [Saccharospirillum impatiens]